MPMHGTVKTTYCLLMTALVVGLVSPNPATADSAPVALSGATPLETALLKDAEDGTLSDFSLIDAAFIVSGLPDREELDAYRARYLALVDRIRERIAEIDDDYGQAKAAFEYLHGHVFKKYGLHAVDMVGVFNSGEYNCVSATVLFNSVLRDLNIESSGVLVPSHAYSLVYTDRGEIEVETTSPHGFNPARTADEYRKLLEKYRLTGEMYETVGDKKVARAALIKEIGGKRKLVNNTTMAAIIYSNIASARVLDGDTRSALALFVKASALASDNEYFLTTRDAFLNNIVVDLIHSGEFQRAISVAREARKIPDLSDTLIGRLVNWSVFAYSKLAIRKKEAGLFPDSVAMYNTALQKFPGNNTLLHNRMAAYISWGIYHINQKQFRDGCTVLLSALKLYPFDHLVQKNYLASVQKYARALKQAGKLQHSEEVARFALRQAEALPEVSASDYLIPRLHLELGFTLFDSTRYKDAATHFSTGLPTGDSVFVNNYAAAMVNLTKQLLDEDLFSSAFEHATAAVRLLESHGTGADSLWTAYWTAAVAHAFSLQEEGNPESALNVLTARPVSTLPPARLNILDTYATVLSSIYIDLEQFEQCAEFLRTIEPDLSAGDWLEERLSFCRSNVE